MRSRRTFFAKIAAIAATVALAPQIAFGIKPERIGLDIDELIRLCYAIKIRREMENYYAARYYNERRP